MKIYSIHDKEFEIFGQVIDCQFFTAFSESAKNIAVPETGCSYMASVPSFETKETLTYYREYFGDMDIQIGYCWGRNNKLNALEWHKSSEVHCALEDMILLLGEKRLMIDYSYDTSNIKAFYVKKGESIEIYATTLHFCPAMTNEKVFKNVVILPKGTNTQLGMVPSDKKLISRNKWLIVHPDFIKQVKLGRVIGLTGNNIVVV